MNEHTKYISVVIPAYNEGGHLEDSLGEVIRYLETADATYEIILVDDGSSDATWESVKTLSSKDECICGLRLSRNFGKEAAMSAGLDNARGDAVIVMDADLQHPPSLIPQMIELWNKEGAHVVDAVKIQRADEPMLRRLGAQLFNGLMQRMAGFDIAGASDYKLIDRKVIDCWKQMPEYQTFYRGMVEWMGFNHVRLPFEVHDRVAGKSSWSYIKLAALSLTAVTSFTTLPLQLVTFMGFMFLMGAMLMTLWTLYIWFSGQAMSGFSTVILLQLINGSIFMISLGILGRYIANIYQEAKRRPRYFIAEHANLEPTRRIH